MFNLTIPIIFSRAQVTILASKAIKSGFVQREYQLHPSECQMKRDLWLVTTAQNYSRKGPSRVRKFNSMNYERLFI